MLDISAAKKWWSRIAITSIILHHQIFFWCWALRRNLDLGCPTVSCRRKKTAGNIFTIALAFGVRVIADVSPSVSPCCVCLLHLASHFSNVLHIGKRLPRIHPVTLLLIQPLVDRDGFITLAAIASAPRFERLIIDTAPPFPVRVVRWCQLQRLAMSRFYLLRREAASEDNDCVYLPLQLNFKMCLLHSAV